MPSGALPGLPWPAHSRHWPALARVTGWSGVALVAAAALGADHRGAAAAAVGVVLLVGSVRLGFPWATVLAVASAVVADAFVVRYGRLGWDWRIDTYVIALAFVVAALGAMVRWLRLAPLVGAAVGVGVASVRERWPGRRDPDRRRSPRPFNRDERLWELELTHR